METTRLEAFSDGVLAIVITIMVLEIDPPGAPTWAGLRDLLPELISYLASFVFVAIYWVNHHQLFRATPRINGKILWLNIAWLFWASLIPFVTKWAGQAHMEALPLAVYGINLFLAALFYTVLEIAIVRLNPGDEVLQRLHRFGWKEKLSLALYVGGVLCAFLSPVIPIACYLAVAGIWFIPDRRLEA